MAPPPRSSRRSSSGSPHWPWSGSSCCAAGDGSSTPRRRRCDPGSGRPALLRFEQLLQVPELTPHVALDAAREDAVQHPRQLLPRELAALGEARALRAERLEAVLD